MSLI
jgi:hypothetical protein